MTRPLTIGERQKLRTAEQRAKSRAKGTETRRKNKLAQAQRGREMIANDIGLLRFAFDQNRKRLQAAVDAAHPTLWQRVKAWWRT